MAKNAEPAREMCWTVCRLPMTLTPRCDRDDNQTVAERNAEVNKRRLQRAGSGGGLTV